MNERVLIYVSSGNFAIIQKGRKYIMNVLFPNFYPNSHLDVSKDFDLDISSFVKNSDFDKLAKLADTIRKNYDKFKIYEILSA